MTIILGIDPGSQRTGFGLISAEGGRHRYVTSGVIRLPKNALPERLNIIFRSLNTIIDEYRPSEAAVEEVFMAKSAGSALSLGRQEARRWWPVLAPISRWPSTRHGR